MLRLYHDLRYYMLKYLKSMLIRMHTAYILVRTCLFKNINVNQKKNEI